MQDEAAHEEPATDAGFSGTRTAKVVGITYRQLDYWARTDLIRPSLADAEGSGSRRKYSYNDLLELKAIKKLLDAGIKLEQVRKVFEYLREHVTTDIAAAHIVIDGSSVNLYDDGQLIDVLQKGQGVFERVVDGWREERARSRSATRLCVRRTLFRLARRRTQDRMSLRQSPLADEHRALDADLVDFGGWEMPLAYPTGTIAEHMACRGSAAMFDVSHLGTVRVDGHDAFDRLQATLTNDLAKIAPGRAQYTHLLDADDASVLDDVIVWWHPRPDGDRNGDADVFDVMPNASNTDRVVAALAGTDTTDSRAIIAVQGPDARLLLAPVLPRSDRGRTFPGGPLPMARRRLRGRRYGLHGRGGRRDRGSERHVPPALARPRRCRHHTGWARCA